MVTIVAADGTSTRYPGVIKSGRKFYPRVRVGKKIVYIGGGFETPEEAHAVYAEHRAASKPLTAEPKRQRPGRSSTVQKMTAYVRARERGASDVELQEEFGMYGDEIALNTPDGAILKYEGFDVIPAVYNREGGLWLHPVPYLKWSRECRLCKTPIAFRTLPLVPPDATPATCPACAAKESAVEVTPAPPSNVADLV